MVSDPLIPDWVVAGGWGFVAASALLLGALLGRHIRFSPKVIAHVMAFGSGILVVVFSSVIPFVEKDVR